MKTPSIVRTRPPAKSSSYADVPARRHTPVLCRNLIHWNRSKRAVDESLAVRRIRDKHSELRADRHPDDDDLLRIESEYRSVFLKLFLQRGRTRRGATASWRQSTRHGSST